MKKVLFVFHFDISGKLIKEEHSENKPSIEIILFVSHFEISGKLNNLEHPENKKLMLFNLLVFHFEISDKDFNDEKKIYSKHYQFSNQKYQVMTLRKSIHKIANSYL